MPLPSWTEETGYRWRPLSVEPGTGPGFTAMSASQTGVSFGNVLTDESRHANQMLANGSGVALGDVDGDGRVDLYLTRLDGPNALYRNLGDWRFEEVAGRAGVRAPDVYSAGAAMADVDGDRDLDLLVSVMGSRNLLYLNDGSGAFTEVGEERGLSSELGSSSMTLADIDGDGDLDLYVGNYKTIGLLDLYPPQERSFEATVVQRDGEFVLKEEFRDHYELVWEGSELVRLETAEPDELYLNDGSGFFEEVSFLDGRFRDADGAPLEELPNEWTLAVRFQDVDLDGDPDLYVCNDLHSPDHFWLNDGTGHFTAVSNRRLRTTSASTMAIDFADVDRDGLPDFLTADMLSPDARRRKTQMPAMRPPLSLPGEIDSRPQRPRNALFVNRGDGTYTEVAQYAGVEASGWSWSVVFLDVDLDGHEDILLPSGHLWDLLDGDADALASESFIDDWRRVKEYYPELRLPNTAFRNNGDLTFERVSEAWGFGGEADVSHGMALGDLDNDGDADAVVNRLGSRALLLRNDASANRIAVRLRGRPPNTEAVGARIRVLGGAVPEQGREVVAGGLYLSHSDPLYSFATGGADAVTVAVEWRSGERTVLEGLVTNRVYVIDEETAPRASSEEREEAAASEPFFREPDDAPAVQHPEPFFNDFRRQPLLPDRMSQLGPGVAWHDLDGDGDSDLLMGAGAGGSLGVLLNEGGAFRRVAVEGPASPLDQTTVLTLPTRRGSALLVGQSNYESADPESARAAPSVLRYDFAPGALRSPRPAPGVTPAVPGALSSTGPLALADYDGDGDLDLFVGGRVWPTAYPAPADSRLFLNEEGRFEPDRANSTLLERIGLVSAAVFSDLDGDGDPDLLLALDWGPLALLDNDGGRFRDVTEARGLARITNRWNGVTTGDLDGDGRLDIVATAWGMNTEHDPTPERPLQLYYGDFDQNGTVEAIEARHEPRLGGVAPLTPFERLSRAMPHVRRTIVTFDQYADARLEEVLGPAASQAGRAEVSHLSHMLFLNRERGFERRTLPLEAQLAPAFYAGVADFDGDGAEDVFIAQNFFATGPGRARYDSGRGLWMRGDGSGGLSAVPGQESGIEVYGDSRGAALGDFDADGRVDLAVSQNGARLKLYRNQRATPGLRVVLEGGSLNPHAVGAAVRAVYAEGRSGPVREVKAGSGYWSQDDPVPVLGLSEPPSAVWVRWPGGREVQVPIDPGARQVKITER